jgi:hypothetical protein
VPLSPRGGSRLAAVDSRLGDRAIRLVSTALLGVVLLAAGAAAATPDQTPPAALRSSRVLADGQPTRVLLPAPLARVSQDRTPTSHRPAVAPAPARRWLPSGTGMWLHNFGSTEAGNPDAIVRRALSAGLTTLYVQTGSSKKGWIGSGPLLALLPATRGTDLKVVAWDFPTLADPVADAQRLAKAARYRCPGCARVAAVAPDVETAAEGTRIGEAAVARYYGSLRAALPPDIAILATVPWPSEKRVGKYPYARTAALVDALMPMTYWYNRAPGQVTTTSMNYLHALRRPVLPVGQGFDGRVDAPYLSLDLHPGVSVQAFLDSARAHGAQAVSLWSWETTGDEQWEALAWARKLFRP